MKNIEKFSNFELISELYRRFCTNSVHISTSIVPINAVNKVHKIDPDNEEFKKMWRNLDGTEWPEPD